MYGKQKKSSRDKVVPAPKTHELTRMNPDQKESREITQDHKRDKFSKEGSGRSRG